MNKLSVAISAVVAVVTGVIADSFFVGIGVFNGLVVLGLLMIIAYAVQELVPKTQKIVPENLAGSGEPANDEDLIEDVEFVWNEEIGELVELPAPKRGRH